MSYFVVHLLFYPHFPCQLSCLEVATFFHPYQSSSSVTLSSPLRLSVHTDCLFLVSSSITLSPLLNYLLPYCAFCLFIRSFSSSICCCNIDTYISLSTHHFIYLCQTVMIMLHHNKISLIVSFKTFMRVYLKNFAVLQGLLYSLYQCLDWLQQSHVSILEYHQRMPEPMQTGQCS